MSNSAKLHLSDNALAALSGIQRGIEKEGLRFTPNAQIAQTAHPAALGSTLTHPNITTDYSESLLEFITPKQSSLEDSIGFLTDLHNFTLSNIGDEQVWPASMPCRLQGEESIPIAVYGSSNVGMMKHIYRRGLAVRYGRIMQSIAGIHYNVSLSDDFWHAYQAQLGVAGSMGDFRSERYFHLIRNFHRHSWLLYYLFGASPVLDESFFDGRTPSLQKFNSHTYGAPYATSLRMSDLGYTNSAQQDLHISYDSLADYIKTLSFAVHQPHQPYEDIGIKNTAGDYIQLNANILQIENEYYSEIRPKRVARSGERPVQALQDRGVEYIEVRALDINPFLPVGIDATEGRFIDAFVVYCLLSDSPQQCPNEWSEIADNLKSIINQGRNPDLHMTCCGETDSVQDWASNLINKISESAALLDESYGTDLYGASIEQQRLKADDPSNTPSGQLMQMVEDGGEFIDIVQSLSQQHYTAMQQQGLDAEVDQQQQEIAEQSLAEHAQREQQDEISFDQYLEDYNQL